MDAEGGGEKKMDGAASFGVTDAGGENPATDEASPNWNIDGGWGGAHVVPLSPVCGVAMGLRTISPSTAVAESVATAV